MKRSNAFYLILIFSTFTLFVCFSLIFKVYERQNAPKINLSSNKNPLEVSLPSPRNSNLTTEEIKNLLINVQDKQVIEINVDDIE